MLNQQIPRRGMAEGIREDSDDHTRHRSADAATGVQKRNPRPTFEKKFAAS